MAHVILNYSAHPPENPPPERSMRDRLGWVWAAIVRGVASFGGKVAALSAFVGGSVLTYAIFVVHLSASWAIACLLGVVLIIFVTGAYRLWSEAYDAAWRFAPTWENLQTRADNLRALVEEYSYDGSGELLDDLTQVSREKKNQFRRQFMAGHMVQTRQDYDRAVAAGFEPDFDRDRISSCQLEDVAELVAAFDAAVEH